MIYSFLLENNIYYRTVAKDKMKIEPKQMLPNN